MTLIKTLYRPVGEKEMVLILKSQCSGFPPRLEWQPIFYPVLNEKYASEIAKKWNTKDPEGNYLGFVTKFDIRLEEFNLYKVENVGSKHHNELWVPAETLEQFNTSIVGKIEVVNIFKGNDFIEFNHQDIQELLKTFYYD